MDQIVEAPKTLEGKVRLRRKMEKCESTGNSSKECGPAVVGGIDTRYTCNAVKGAERRSALPWRAVSEKRTEPFRRACLMRYEQMSLLAVCACSATSTLHFACL